MAKVIVIPTSREFSAILDSYTGPNEDKDNPRDEYVVLFRWLLGEVDEAELLRMFPDWTKPLKALRVSR